MDTIAHILWGYIIVYLLINNNIFKDKKLLIWTAFFSALPDLVGLFFIESYLKFDRAILPESRYQFYYATHSLIAISLIFIILLIFKRRYLFFIVPYLVHILFDLPLHCSVYSTRLFYPFSDFHFCGYSYAHHLVIVLPINYLLICLSLFLFGKKNFLKSNENFINSYHQKRKN